MTKNQQKLIKSLDEKKYRNELGLFIVEGEKNVAELLHSDFVVDSLFMTQYFLDKYQDLIFESLQRAQSIQHASQSCRESELDNI